MRRLLYNEWRSPFILDKAKNAERWVAVPNTRRKGNIRPPSLLYLEIRGRSCKESKSDPFNLLLPIELL